jgi:hypothetical protein
MGAQVTGKEMYPTDPLLAEAFEHGRTQERLARALEELDRIHARATGETLDELIHRHERIVGGMAV